MLFFHLALLDNDNDKNIFEERYEQFKFDCLHIANVILHDISLAEDAVHEAFLSIIKNREKYLPLSSRDFAE